MNGLKSEAHERLEGKRVGFWRSSTYDEPTWVSLAWIVVPLLIAGTLIYSIVG
jgi:hypothetical protein